MVITWIDQFVMLVTGIFMVPMYLKAFGDHVYGVWLATGGVVAWVAMFNVSMVSGQRAASACGRRRFIRATSYFWGGLCINVALSLVLSSVGWFIVTGLLRIWDLSTEESSALQRAVNYSMLAMMLQFWISSSAPFLQAVQRPVYLLYARPIMAISQLGVLFGGIRMGCGIWIIPMALLVRNAVLATFAMIPAVWISLKLARRVIISKATLRDVLRSTSQVVFGYVIMNAGPKLSLLILSLFMSPTWVAAYDITLRPILFINTVIGRITVVLIPALSHLVGSGDLLKSRRIMRAGIVIVASIAIIAASGYVVFVESFVNLWVGNSRYVGDVLAFSAALGLFYTSMSQQMSNYVHSSGGVGYAALGGAAGSVVAIVWTYLVASLAYPELVPIGAVLASIILITTYAKGLRKRFVVDVVSLKLIGIMALAALLTLLLATLFGSNLNLQSWVQFVTAVSIFLMLSLLVALPFFWRKHRAKII